MKYFIWTTSTYINESVPAFAPISAVGLKRQQRYKFKHEQYVNVLPLYDNFIS